MADKLEFVRDGFGELQRFTVTLRQGLYKAIHLSSEVTKKVEDSRTQAKVTAPGMYYLRKGDIVLR